MTFIKKHPYITFIIFIITAAALYFMICCALYFFEPVSYNSPNLENYKEYFDMYAYYDKSVDDDFYIKQITADDIKTYENDKRLKYVKNTAIAAVADDISYSEVTSLLNEYNAEICGYIKDVNFYQIEFNTDLSLDKLSAVCETLSQNGVFEIVLPDYFEEAPENYESTEYEGAYSRYYYDMINAYEAWKVYFMYDNSVNVGMIDVFSDYNNSYLNIKNSDTYSTDTLYNTLLSGSQNHGTHVAGIINSNHNSDAPGMAPNANLFSYNGMNVSTSYWIAVMCDMLINKEVKAINISMGYNSYIDISAQLGDKNALKFIENENTLFSKILSNIINSGKEFVICIPSGNSTTKSVYKTRSLYFGYGDKKILGMIDFERCFDILPDYVDAKYSFFISDSQNPEVADRIISVGSVGEDYTYTYFSNAGSVDIAAPGEYIYSTVLNNEYDYMSGTSMATPFVTGTAAMMFTVNPDLTGKDVKDILISSATKTVTAHGFEYPILNSGEAVKYAAEKY